MPREPSRGASRSGAPPAGVAPRRSGAPRESFPVQAAVAALVAFPFVVALDAWLMTGGRLGVVATSLVAGLPAVIVASLLLLREHRRGSRAEASLEGVEARLRGIVTQIVISGVGVAVDRVDYTQSDGDSTEMRLEPAGKP